MVGQRHQVDRVRNILEGRPRPSRRRTRVLGHRDGVRRKHLLLGEQADELDHEVWLFFLALHPPIIDLLNNLC